MFWPNCHWSLPRLPRPKRLGSSSPRNPPTPVPCPSDAPKLMLPVRRSSTRKMMSTSTPLAAGLHVRGWKRLLEEPQVGDVLVGADQPLPAEEIAREHDDRLPDHPLVGHVVAHDLDLVDRGRRALADVPATGPPAGCPRAPGAPDLLGLDLGVDVAVVGVQVLHLLRGRVPLRTAERAGLPGRRARGPNRPERIERLSSSVEKRRLPWMSKVPTR